MAEVSNVGLNIAEKSTVIWNVADMLRGPFKPHEYGLVILPMTVIKRFNDCLIVSVLVLIGYLIYLIPGGEENNNLQEIVLTLASAVIGGALTLAGVAWTIKKTDNDRKEDERKKAKPIIGFIPLKERKSINQERKVKLITERDYHYVIYAEIENSPISSFVINSIFIDEKWHKPEGNTTVLPGNTVYLELRCQINPTKILICIDDALSNKYYYELKTSVFDGKNVNQDDAVYYYRINGAIEIPPSELKCN